MQVSPQAARFPRDLWDAPIRRTALCDFLTRSFGKAVSRAGADVRTEGGGWHGQKGGEMTVDTPGQHVLQRTSCLIDDQVCLRISAVLVRFRHRSPPPSIVNSSSAVQGAFVDYMQGGVEARFTVALPARGRTILGHWAAQILVTNLPR